MQICTEVSEMSTCARLQTGALLVRDKRIISIGYNGVVSGDQHCYDIWKEMYEVEEGLRAEHDSLELFLESATFRAKHHEWAVKNELHGEQNAILYASKSGISTDKCEMYTTYSPCIHCAKVIISAGIIQVYYQIEYSRDLTGISFLRNHGIPCLHLPARNES